ncbi:MAG: hypothetical protein V7K32_23060 [Nostoc sp.]
MYIPKVGAFWNSAVVRSLMACRYSTISDLRYVHTIPELHQLILLTPT